MQNKSETHDLNITILYDNLKHSPLLKEGFGFSCLIEWNDSTILFDSGGTQDDLFSNMDKLQIEWEQITHVAFSHKHWDHTAGFEEILAKLKPRSSVCLPKPFPKKFIRKVPDHLMLKSTESFDEIGPNVYSLVLRGGLFLYEQALILDTIKGLVIITGCAHPGIDKIVLKAKQRLNRPVHLVLGGFHLCRSSTSAIEKIIHTLKEAGVEKVAPCHCTGNKAMKHFEEMYHTNHIRAGTGMILEIECESYIVENIKKR